MFIPSYLMLSRHYIFYFRYPVLVSDGNQINRRFIKLSLDTKDKRKANQLSKELETLVRMLLAGRDILMALEYGEIVNLVRAYFEKRYKATINRIKEQGAFEPLQIAAYQNMFHEAESMLHHPEYKWARYQNKPQTPVEAMLSSIGVQVEPQSTEFKSFHKEYCKGAMNFAQQVMDYSESYNDGAYRNLAKEEPVQEITPVINGKAQVVSTLLQTVIDEYLLEGRRTGQWAGRTLSEVSEFFNTLIEILGEGFDIARLDKSKAKAVKDTLLCLPKNRNINPKTRDLTLDKQLVIADVERISGTTINKYISYYSGLMKWAIDNGYADKNPFEGMKVKTFDKIVRTNFTDEEMKVIIDALLSGHASGQYSDTYFWGVLIAMYTGARLNEVASLTCSDMRWEEGIWYFDINDEEETKSLKTKAAKRKVPVHPDLLRLGFREFYETTSQEQKTGQRLLRDLTFQPRTKWGRNLGRWFNEQFLVELDIKSKEKVFHSLRHTVITKLTHARVELETIQNLVGHEPNTVTHKFYVHGCPMPQLQDGIGKLSYPLP